MTRNQAYVIVPDIGRGDVSSALPEFPTRFRCPTTPSDLRDQTISRDPPHARLPAEIPKGDHTYVRVERGDDLVA